MAAAYDDAVPKLIPARLSFFAIYNPKFGPTDETFPEQVVYWYSRATKERRKDGSSRAENSKLLQEEENEKLRQIGLAQGMVNFSTSFADGQATDSIETEKSRVIIHELEEGWWILASIDLTRIPVVASSTSSASPPTISIDYSSREISAPALLRTQLAQAHRIFLMHHGRSLDDLFIRHTRSKFCGLLERFWNRFLSDWDVLLHGNPSVIMYDGLKLSAGGELGLGVGEEEWGSGERDVLEGYAGRTEGLVDMLVSRFGDGPAQSVPATKPGQRKHRNPDNDEDRTLKDWLGAGNPTEGNDGVIFSGTGAIARSSLRDLAIWMQWIYTYGDFAYGVKENPSSERRRRKKPTKQISPSQQKTGDGAKRRTSASKQGTGSNATPTPPGIPPPIVSAVERSLLQATRAASSNSVKTTKSTSAENTEADGWTKYLKLGYGSSWGTSTQPTQPPQPSETTEAADITAESTEPTPTENRKPSAMKMLDPTPDVDTVEEARNERIRQDARGHFLIGLTGPLEEDVSEDDASEQRIVLRTVYLRTTTGTDLPVSPGIFSEASTPADNDMTSPFSPHSPPPKLERSSGDLARLRVIVYVNQPFIYTFLFDLRTSSLQLSSFYRNLHTYLSPLRPLLLRSTNPERVASRIASAGLPYPIPIPATSQSNANPVAGGQTGQEPIYDLVYDQTSLSIHSNIPNIPVPGSLASEGLGSVNQGQGWTRAEALNVHTAIIDGYVRSRESQEVERSIKTNRGWWIVWMRLGVDEEETHDKTSHSPETSEESTQPGYARSDVTLPGSIGKPATESEPSPEETIKGAPSYFQDNEPSPVPLPRYKEAILVRRARDSAQARNQSGTRSVSGLWGFGGGAGKDTSAGWGPARLAEGVGVDARKYVEGLIGLGR